MEREAIEGMGNRNCHCTVHMDEYNGSLGKVQSCFFNGNRELRWFDRLILLSLGIRFVTADMNGE